MGHGKAGAFLEGFSSTFFPLLAARQRKRAAETKFRQKQHTDQQEAQDEIDLALVSAESFVRNEGISRDPSDLTGVSGPTTQFRGGFTDVDGASFPVEAPFEQLESDTQFFDRIVSDIAGQKLQNVPEGRLRDDILPKIRERILMQHPDFRAFKAANPTMSSAQLVENFENNQSLVAQVAFKQQRIEQILRNSGGNPNTVEIASVMALMDNDAARDQFLDAVLGSKSQRALMKGYAEFVGADGQLKPLSQSQINVARGNMLNNFLGLGLSSSDSRQLAKDYSEILESATKTDLEMFEFANDQFDETMKRNVFSKRGAAAFEYYMEQFALRTSSEQVPAGFTLLTDANIRDRTKISEEDFDKIDAIFDKADIKIEGTDKRFDLGRNLLAGDDDDLSLLTAEQKADIQPQLEELNFVLAGKGFTRAEILEEIKLPQNRPSFSTKLVSGPDTGFQLTVDPDIDQRTWENMVNWYGEFMNEVTGLENSLATSEVIRDTYRTRKRRISFLKNRSSQGLVGGVDLKTADTATLQSMFGDIQEAFRADLISPAVFEDVLQKLGLRRGLNGNSGAIAK